MSLNVTTTTNSNVSYQNEPYQNEPLLTEEQRYTLHPIKHVDIWESFKKQEANFWTAEEVDLSSDKKDWNLLNEDERYFLRNILAFFAATKNWDEILSKG